MVDDKVLKDLKIKLGIVKRLHKDLLCYEKEASKEREKIKQMEEADPTDYMIKKAKEQHQETLQMMPMITQKLNVARTELSAFLELNAAELSDAPELEAAREQLTAAAQ